MSEWKAVPQKRQEIGECIVDYLRNPDRHGEGGHEVTFPDGQRLRVLPDDVTTAKERMYAIVSGLTHIEDCTVPEDNPAAIVTFDPVAYVVGCLALRGADRWEIASERMTPEEILRDVMSDGWTGPDAARKAVRELEDAGYRITTEAG